MQDDTNLRQHPQKTCLQRENIFIQIQDDPQKQNLY